MFSKTNFLVPAGKLALLLSAMLAIGGLAGCERKERVFELQTPGADVEVDRNIDTGEVEIDVEDND